MKIFRAILDSYIQSSFHVALSVMALATLSVFQFGFVPEPSLLFSLFFGTICGYNFVKYSGISNRHHLEITNHILLIRIFTVLSLGGFLYFGRLQPVELWYTFGILSVLTGLYAIPFYKGRSLRSVKGLKVIVIALVWVGFTVVIPLQYHHMLYSERGLLQCLEVFLFVIVLMIPFEIRDLKYDELELSTIPQVLGILKTKWLGTALLLIIGLLVYFQNYLNESYLHVNFGILVLTLLFVWMSKVEQGKYYASFWVESIPIIWLVAYLFM